LQTGYGRNTRERVEFITVSFAKDSGGFDNSVPPNPVAYLSRISVPRAYAEANRGGFVESILPTTAST